MRIVRWQAPEVLEPAEVDDPVAGDGQLVLEVAACGICGSDLHSYERGFAAVPGQVLGHEFAGRVLDAPGVDGVAVGDRVTVRPLTPCGRCARCAEGEIQLCEAGHAQNIGYGSPGAFADRVLVPRATLGETVFHLPDGVGDEAGALVEPLAVSLRAVRHAAPRPDETVLVLGAGMIGLGAVRLLRLEGAGTIVVADPSPARRERALALGADVAVDPTTEDVTTVVRGITGAGAFGLGARADAVIDCAGAPSAFHDGLKSVRHGGRMVLAAMYSRKVELRPDRIVEKELRVLGSMGYRHEFPDVIRYLADGGIDADAFISHRFPLSRVDEAFRVQLGRSDALKVVVRPGDDR
ncbi:MAG: alcohol dehydrogenase catalytic domain-containing protein [Solirubrobacteraceae bacterium]|nr:alcohol dehydrogenase catalytic domain-containing protein [Solirubrobacteraceae bacterium]